LDVTITPSPIGAIIDFWVSLLLSSYPSPVFAPDWLLWVVVRLVVGPLLVPRCSYAWLPLSSHWNVYLPSLKVPCVDLDLDLEPGKRLALPRSVMTIAVFANVVFLARGVVVAAPNPFSPQGENSFMERWTMAAFSLFPPWQHRPA
jgi:hypothetical protein